MFYCVLQAQNFLQNVWCDIYTWNLFFTSFTSFWYMERGQFLFTMSNIFYAVVVNSCILKENHFYFGVCLLYNVKHMFL